MSEIDDIFASKGKPNGKNKETPGAGSSTPTVTIQSAPSSKKKKKKQKTAKLDTAPTTEPEADAVTVTATATKRPAPETVFDPSAKLAKRPKPDIKTPKVPTTVTSASTEKADDDERFRDSRGTGPRKSSIHCAFYLVTCVIQCRAEDRGGVFNL